MFRSRDSRYSQKFKQMIWPKKGFQRSFYYLRERVSRMSGSTQALALGVACGAAASMTPFLGLHFIIAAVLAYLVRGNLFTSAIGTIVGNPWSFPLIWAADNYVGGLIINQFGLDNWLANMGANAGPDMPMAFFFKITIGGVVLAIVSFPIYYGLSYWGLASWRAHRARKKAAKAAALRAKQEPMAPTMSEPVAMSGDKMASEVEAEVEPEVAQNQQTSYHGDTKAS